MQDAGPVMRLALAAKIASAHERITLYCEGPQAPSYSPSLS